MMVGQVLLTQAADKEVGEVSEDDLDDTMDEFLEQNQMEDKDELMDALKEQGEDEDEFMDQLKQQAQVDKYIDQEADISEPSDDEIEEAYEDMKQQQQMMEQQEEMDEDDNNEKEKEKENENENENADDEKESEVPELDEVKDDLIAQLEEQEKAEATQDIVDKLRDDADVTVHI